MMGEGSGVNVSEDVEDDVFVLEDVGGCEHVLVTAHQVAVRELALYLGDKFVDQVFERVHGLYPLL